MASNTQEIIDEFVQQLDSDKEYNLQDLKKILADVYKSKTAKKAEPKPKATKPPSDDEGTDDDKPKKRGRPPSKPKLDKDGNIKQKKAPSPYNNFVSEKIKELKHADSNKTARELMLEAAKLWKELPDEEKEKYKTPTAV